MAGVDPRSQQLTEDERRDDDALTFAGNSSVRFALAVRNKVSVPPKGHAFSDLKGPVTLAEDKDTDPCSPQPLKMHNCQFFM